MTEPEAEAPQASADYRPELAPPISDGFYRAIGEYARAENAKAEPQPDPEADLAYWEEAHAAFHHCAAEDARIWGEPEPEPDPLPEPEPEAEI